MTDAVRCWFVERDYTDRDLIVLTYATLDGERSYRKELSVTVIDRYDVTAAVDVDPDNLEHIDDPDRRERYATEAERMANSHDPDDEV
ncbi:hypothetical protein AUR64_01845 [Haloprofundus marisrubri]|uniref:DUF7967 domain-containing protein n=1 Tax=Haloprofundus marisrubri TaxID=1514971 RepID=A0A0W1R4F9_9EURY|nr:hypothetical protein [Haloprofundus marisrubri]KTG08018.1 hypothetical protein AUR64_01845 [Haloprofundus marisrubri]